eukprot:scaffold827_cov369-Prasinococcus_capsulatus_cf.AAC.32
MPAPGCAPSVGPLPPAPRTHARTHARASTAAIAEVRGPTKGARAGRGRGRGGASRRRSARFSPPRACLLACLLARSLASLPPSLPRLASIMPPATPPPLPLRYALVARGEEGLVVLCEHAAEARERATHQALALKCLRTAALREGARFTFTCQQHTFNCVTAD